MIDINDDRWISIEEAAIYLGVNKDTIRNWIKKENGTPAHKIGKLWKFKKSELDTWVKSGDSAEWKCRGFTDENYFAEFKARSVSKCIVW